MNKLKQEIKDFTNFASVYPGYCVLIFIVGFALGALHQYFGL